MVLNMGRVRNKPEDAAIFVYFKRRLTAFFRVGENIMEN